MGPIREQLLDALPGRGRPKKLKTDLKPVSAYEKDHAKAQPFDRDTSEPISKAEQMTYAETLASYHLSAKSKFGNGRPFDRGRTERRDVVGRMVKLIARKQTASENWERPIR
jgi:hypothetical protein